MAAEQSSICWFQGPVRCDLRRSRFSINSGLIPGFDSLNLQPLVRLHKIYLSGVDSPAPYQNIADPIVLVGRIKLLRNVWVVKLADIITTTTTTIYVLGQHEIYCIDS